MARHLEDGGLATLLVDLLTDEEEAAERHTRHLRFDIGLLIDRLGGLLWREHRRGGGTRGRPARGHRSRRLARRAP